MASMSEMPQDEVYALWAQYKATHDPLDRDRLILTYAPLVKYVVGRINITLPPSLDQSDLLHYGVLGLIDAIERFQPERNLRFETYAVPRIRGAIIDELRHVDWVPRSVRAKAKKIDAANTEVLTTEGRAATEDEIAEATGFTVPEIRKVVGAFAQAHVDSLDAAGDHTTDAPETESFILPVDVEFDADASRYLVADAIRDLDDRERLVVGLYYYENLTLSEIGEVIDVTESRVSQIHTGALSKIRERVGSVL